MSTLVECVPNFSEGRDRAKVDAIVEAIRGPGIHILDREMDEDHNRSVITFVGSLEEVGEAALRGVARAVQLIDLNQHQGAHPRIGAADVVPFVPLEGVGLEDCVALARRVGQAIWQRLGVPVYLYEAAATRPERRNLENIRRGHFEGLRQEIGKKEERRPDFGEARVHPSAGATAVGARKFLIAYNINLNTPEVQIAHNIARAIRASSGGLPFVKAMGVPLKARRLAQVSMNLTDFEQTSIFTVFEAVQREAARQGVEIVGSEIIGLVPKKALEMAAASFLKIENFDPALILENRLAAVMGAERPAGPLGGERPPGLPRLRARCEAFVDAVAAPTATPGGGSVAALAGALAASLGQMVAGLSLGKPRREGRRPAKTAHAQQQPRLRGALQRLAALCEELKQAVDDDAASYDAVSAAYQLPRGSAGRDEAIQEALRGATEIPVGVGERAAEIRALLQELVPLTSPNMASDLKMGALLAEAALEGARANVEVNLASILDQSYAANIRRRLPPLSTPG